MLEGEDDREMSDGGVLAGVVVEREVEVGGDKRGQDGSEDEDKGQDVTAIGSLAEHDWLYIQWDLPA